MIVHFLMNENLSFVPRPSESAHKKKFILFYSPESETVASQLLRQSERFEKGEINWGKFEDGFPNLFIKNVESIGGRDILFLCSFLNQQEMLGQLSVLYSLPRYFARSMIVILPYFPTGTMERVDEEGQIATAVTFARLLSGIPITQNGPSKLLIYDIHALQNRFYFSDNVVPLLVSAIPLFLRVLNCNHAEENVVIAFPDDGAKKRFANKFSIYPIVTCIKIREESQRLVYIKEGAEHLKGAHVFIVDDLVKTGGTLIECKNALLKAGAVKISAFVTHSIFPCESWRKFSENLHDPFTVFYTTDSCPEVTSVLQGKKPFVVLPLAESIANHILSYANH